MSGLSTRVYGVVRVCVCGGEIKTMKICTPNDMRKTIYGGCFVNNSRSLKSSSENESRRNYTASSEVKAEK